MIAASAVAAGPAFADEAMGVPIIDYYLPSAAERTTGAGATLRVPQGWSATLFVSSLGPRRGADDGVPQLKSSTFVNARLGRNQSVLNQRSIGSVQPVHAERRSYHTTDEHQHGAVGSRA